MNKAMKNFLVAMAAVAAGAIALNTAEAATRSTSFVGRLIRGTWIKRVG